MLTFSYEQTISMDTIQVLLVCFFLVSAAKGVDVNTLQDQKCLKNPPKAVQPDSDWTASVGNWYLSAGSQLHLYRPAADVSTVPIANIAPHDLYYKSCLRFEWGQQTVVTGFGDKEADCTLKSTNDDGSFTFHYANVGLDGRATVVLTDNKTFIMFYVCWPKGQEATWAVISSVPVLSSNTRRQIHKQAKALGFDEKQFTRLRFESCGVDDEVESRDEL